MTTLLNLDPSQVPDDGNSLVYNAASKKWLPGRAPQPGAFTRFSPSDLAADHAPAPLTTPTYDGSGQAVHPDVITFAEPWNGYRYWMAMTPYPNSDDQYENPSILASHDGETWEVPPGLTNPIDNPDPGFAPDTDLIMDGTTMWLTHSVTKAHSSTDGVTWSAKQTMSGTFPTGVSQTLHKDGSTFRLWYVNKIDGGAQNVLAHKTAPSLLGPYTANESCTITNMPAGRELWHVDIIKTGDVWVGAFTIAELDSTAAAALHLATSFDGISWDMAPDPILAPTPGHWASGLVYRASLVPLDGRSGAAFDLYYSAMSAAGVWRIGLTQVYDARRLTNKADTNGINTFTAGQISRGDSRNIHPNPTLLVGAAGALVPLGYNNNLAGATGHGWDEAEQAHTWSHATTGGGNMDTLLIPDAPFITGDQWTFSYEAKLSDLKGRVTSALLWRNAGGAVGSTVQGTVTRTVGAYARIYVTGTVPAGADRVTLAHGFTRESAGPVQVWWRRAQMEKASSPTAWTPGVAAIQRATAGQVQNIEEWHTALSPSTGGGARVGFAVTPSARPRLAALTATPTDKAGVGELCVVSGVLYVCTAAGTPGTWAAVGSGGSVAPIMGQVNASSNLTLSGTAADVPGATVTVTAPAAGKLLVVATYDFGLAIGAEIVGGHLWVGGSKVAGDAYLSGSLQRAAITRQWTVSLATGSHVVKLQAVRVSGSNAGHVVNSTHTGFSYVFHQGAT